MARSDMRIYDRNGFPHCLNEIDGKILPDKRKHFVIPSGKKGRYSVWRCIDCKINFTALDLHKKIYEIVGKNIG